MQRWEIAGISAWPVVEALLALNIHGQLGITEVAFLKACIGLMTVAAIARAVLDAKKKPPGIEIVSGPVELAPGVATAIAAELDRRAAPKGSTEATTRRIEGAVDG
jgi:hypothetical protein